MYIDMEKKDIALLICKLREYYYKSSNKEDKNQWSRKEFTKNICSLKTYYLIEREMIIPKEQVINKLLQKLNVKFIYIKDIEDAINYYSSNILHDIEFYEIEQLEKHSKSLLKLIYPYKTYLYYKEIYFIIETTCNFYVNRKLMTQEEYDYLKHIYRVLNNVLKEIGKDLLFKYQYIINNTSKQYISEINKLQLEDTHNVVNKLNLLTFYASMNNFEKTLEEFPTLKANLFSTGNYIRCLELYILYLNSLLIFTYEAIESKFLDVLQKAEKLVKKINSNMKADQFYLNLGIIFTRLGKYEEALKYLSKCDCPQFLYQEYTFILFYYCAQRLEIEHEYDWTKSICMGNENTLYSKKIGVFYMFMKNKALHYTSYKDLQLYLMKNAIIYINKSDILFLDLFQYELYLLMKETHVYSDFHKFYGIVQNNRNAIRISNIDNIVVM